jgi:DNA polymerase-3 subunit alpha
MIAECKRIRTKKGDPMMFATLDDLEGQVELLVFNSAYAANEDKVALDKIVIVRGRVDHKEEGETKLVAQEVEAFEPSAEEVLKAAEAVPQEPLIRRLTIHVEGGVSEAFIDELKEVVSHHRGDHELLLLVGDRRWQLGPDWRVSADGACRAELAGLTGASRLVA